METQLNSKEPVQIMHLLNCCRVFTRIMPFVFESPECIEWEKKFFWTARKVEKPVKPSTDDQKTATQYITLPPRAEVLLSRNTCNQKKRDAMELIFQF